MTARRLRLLRGVSALVRVAVVVGIVELTFWMLPVREASPRLLPGGNDRILSFRRHESWRYSAGWNFWLVEDVRTNNSGWVSDIDYVREADTPLVAFVGDSYIEGDHVPWPDTCHGRLANRLAGESRVYSFAVNGSPLSQYLAYSEYSRDMYRPDILVIPIVENDFDQSLRQYQASRHHALFFAFEEQADGELQLVSPAEPRQQPQSVFRRLRRWINENSRVLRYRTYNVRLDRLKVAEARRRNDRAAAGMPASSFMWTDPADAHMDRVMMSRRVVDAFLSLLPERSGLNPSQIVFVADGIRPFRYTEGWEHRWDGSYHDVMRRYFISQARADGYEVIDMQPVFVDHYHSHRRPFNWLRDNHWNALGHGLCAEQVGNSRALQRLRAGTAVAMD